VNRCRPPHTGITFRARVCRLLLATVMLAPPIEGQTTGGVERERREFTAWLETAPLSPFALVALQPVGAGITIGPEPADVPLDLPLRHAAREQNGVVTLETDGRAMAMPRGRPVPLGRYRLVATGVPGRTVVAVYGATREYRPPAYFPISPSFTFQLSLEPPERRGTFRTLGPDGVETTAVEAGFVQVAIGETRSRLRVYRVGSPADEEPSFLIYFRDGTSGHGTYPAGRFVDLVPVGKGRYELDFNRARNPYCAYSSAYPCPAPWPGNTIPADVTVGEQYQGGHP
jgi:uncharacterized protein